MMTIILQAKKVFIMKKIGLIGFLMIFLSWHPCIVVVRPANSCDIIYLLTDLKITIIYRTSITLINELNKPPCR